MDRQIKLNAILNSPHLGFLWANLADKVWMMENVEFPKMPALVKLRQERIQLLKDTMSLFDKKDE